MTRVVHFGRRPQAGQHSIERVFAMVRDHLPDRFEVEVVTSAHLSRGVVPRIATVAEARRLRAPIVHVTGDINYAALGRPAASTVLTVHDVEFLERSGAPKAAVYSAVWLRGPVRAAGVVTVPSAATAARLARLTGTSPDAFEVIGDPVGGEFVPSPPPQRDRPLLLLVGTTPTKNVARVAAALAGVDCRVEVVGILDRAQREAFGAARVEVTELGRLADADLPGAYARCDALVFASTHEGFGMPILEAQASGRPVVTSDRPPLSDVSGGAAVLADPLDPASIRAAVLAVTGDPALRDRLVGTGLTNAARYRPAAIAAGYAAVYDRLLERPPSPGRRTVAPTAARRGAGRTVLSIQPAADGGGSETGLIRMVRQLQGTGWSCHVALPHEAVLADAYRAAGATLHVVPMTRITTTGGRAHWLRYAAGWPVAVARLVRLGRRLDVDVVHTNSLHSWYGWAVALLLHRPHVWHAREIVVQSRAALALERVLTRHFATSVVATSAATAAQLDRPDAVVMLDEPDPGEYGPDRAGAFRAAVGIADGAPLVGSVARIDTWKGFDVLLDAVPLLRAARPDVEIVVAGAPVGGKDAYAGGLARRAGGLGVHWLGHRSDVAKLIADLDVFVQVSTEPEPLGLVHIEALASGVPIVAGDEGGPAEILATAAPGAGILVRPGDPAALAGAVLTLLGPPSDTAARRRRTPLRTVAPVRYDEVLLAALGRRGT